MPLVWVAYILIIKKGFIIMNDITKRALIHGVDQKNGVLGTTEREQQITNFIKQDKSTTPLEMFKAWLKFQSVISEKDTKCGYLISVKHRSQTFQNCQLWWIDLSMVVMGQKATMNY